MAKAAKKKQKKGRYIWLILLLTVGALSTYIGYILYQQNEAKFAAYPGYDIELPLGYDIHGIDVSYYQGYIYWPAVKKMQVKDVTIDFAFIKATEGLTNTDKQFKRNWQQARAAGITRGAYHFFIPGKSGALQAAHFIKKVTLLPGDLPPVLDVEQLYGTEPALMRQQMTDWLKAVEAAFDVKPIIYTNVDFYERYLGKGFDEYPLWIAHYFAEKRPRTKTDWLFWQHNDGGKVNGIKAKVDFNVFKGDMESFNELLLR